MKKLSVYSEPEMEILQIDIQDVIAASGDEGLTDYEGNIGNDDGSWTPNF